MKQKHKTQKGFTLIELLLVIAIIAIMSTLILMSLDSGRERAELNRYKAYAVQMYRLVFDSATAGYLDGITANGSVSPGTTEYCLGAYSGNCGSNADNNDIIDAALEKWGPLPEINDNNKESVVSPYNKNEGVTISFPEEGRAQVRMYLLGNESAYVRETCDKMGEWYECGGDSCCIDVKLNTRYNDGGATTNP